MYQSLLNQSKISLILKLYASPSSIEMQIVYQFVYYFVALMIILTFSLLIFVFPSARILLYKFRARFNSFFENQLVKYSIYLAFAIILLILFESIFTFSTLSSYYRKKTKYHPDSIGLDELDAMPHNNRQNYMIQLKQYREYYLAERNIMLASSALFIFFAFHQLFINILKYSGTEYRVAVINAIKKD